MKAWCYAKVGDDEFLAEGKPEELLPMLSKFLASPTPLPPVRAVPAELRGVPPEPSVRAVTNGTRRRSWSELTTEERASRSAKMRQGALNRWAKVKAGGARASSSS